MMDRKHGRYVRFMSVSRHESVFEDEPVSFVDVDEGVSDGRGGCLADDNGRGGERGKYCKIHTRTHVKIKGE